MFLSQIIQSVKVAIIASGRLCRIVKGRNAGDPCVVVERIDDHFVSVTGTTFKQQKVNARHLEPYPVEVDLSQDPSPEDVRAAVEKAGIRAK